MTFDELAYNVLDIIRGGQGSNNEYFSLEQIKFQLLYYRALFLRRDATHDSDLQHNEQEFTLTLDIVPVAEDRDSAELSDYLTYILKSTTTFPPTIALRDSYDLTYVGTAGLGAVPLARFYQVQHLAYERFTSCTPRSFTRNNFLYIINDPGVRELEKASGGLPSDASKIPMTQALIRGIFADPRDVTGFDESTSDFPIAPDLVQRITEGLLGGELRFMTEVTTITDLNVVPDEKES